MINLLPPHTKEEYLYARRNTKLAKWSLALLFAFFGVAAIVIFGLFYINQSVNNYSQSIDATKAQLKEQRMEETEEQIKSISGSVKLVADVLSRQIIFSKLIKQIGAAMPPDTALTDLALGEVQGGFDLTAIASDYTTATQVQLNLQDPANQIFEKADIINVSCSSNDTADPDYPCTVRIRALFAKNNSYRLLAPNGGSSQ